MRIVKATLLNVAIVKDDNFSEKRKNTHKSKPKVKLVLCLHFYFIFFFFCGRRMLKRSCFYVKLKNRAFFAKIQSWAKCCGKILKLELVSWKFLAQLSKL